MSPTSTLKKDIRNSAYALGAVLLASYMMSLLARESFFFDLFSHFRFQYAFGGLILCGVFIYLKKKVPAFIMFAVAVLNCAHISMAVDYAAPQTAKAPNFTIATYNRNYGLQNHAHFTKWARKNVESIDVIALLEASNSHSEAAKTLEDIYPHQIHNPKHNAFGMILLSKHEILSQRVIDLQRYALDNFFINVKIKPAKNQIVSVYAVHPPPPTTRLLQLQRNNDMMTTGQHISNDRTENIVMVGDWNITPYSPYFQDLKDVTGLRYETDSIFPKHSWPSMFFLYPLQIPIDHILYKGDMALSSYQRDDAMGSDHYPMIASFSFSR